MSKYIRTKDGEIFELKATPPTNKIYEGSNTYMVYDHKELIAKDINGNDILNQADTIEELCDGFYLDCEERELIDRFYYYDKQYDCFKAFPNSHRGFSRKRFKEYKADLYLRGFIKTDKGLIYIAKMTREGELKLL